MRNEHAHGFVAASLRLFPNLQVLLLLGQLQGASAHTLEAVCKPSTHLSPFTVRVQLYTCHINCLICSLTHALTSLFAQPLTNSLFQTCTHACTHPPTHSPTHSLTHSVAHSPMQPPTHQVRGQLPTAHPLCSSLNAGVESKLAQCRDCMQTCVCVCVFTAVVLRNALEARGAEAALYRKQYEGMCRKLDSLEEHHRQASSAARTKVSHEAPSMALKMALDFS